MMNQALTLAQKTAVQKTRWDDQAETYAEVIIRKDRRDMSSQQVVSAISKHKSLTDGE